MTDEPEMPQERMFIETAVWRDPDGTFGERGQQWVLDTARIPVSSSPEPPPSAPSDTPSSSASDS